MGQRPAAQDDKDPRQWPRIAPSPPSKLETRPPLTFETAVQLCPHQGVAENDRSGFGLIVPEYDSHPRRSTPLALNQLAEAFEGALNDKATAMHFQRIVGALVSSAVGAGRFYSEKVSEARTPPPAPPTAATTNTEPRSASKARRSGPANSQPTWRCKPSLS